MVTAPTNMGNPVTEPSGIGDELNYVPTDKATLQTKIKDNIFAIGDATDIPAYKAGSVAHFEAEILTENILRKTSAQVSFLKCFSIQSRHQWPLASAWRQ